MRPRHFRTDFSVIPTRRAICALPQPCDASNTIRARFAVRAGAVGKRSTRCSFSRSLGGNRIRRAFGPGTHPCDGSQNQKFNPVRTSGGGGLVDVFVGGAGVFVVTNDAVTLVDRAGAVQKTYSSPREITAAAFDGSSLAIFDKAMLTIFASNLTPVAPASMLTEVCAAAAFVGGDRVICGSASDWQRSFYAYSSKTGAKILATLMSETYHGIPMRRVTGKDDFVTVSIGTSPSDFFLHTVDSSSKVIYVSDSPYHGDFAVSLAYTLQGNPAHHLVTEQGLLLNIYDVNCKAGLGSPQCFVKDGMLGTLFGTQRFIGMDNDGTNYVYALVRSEEHTSELQSR